MKRRWPILLLLLLLAGAAPGQAQFTLVTNDGAITITKYTGGGDVAIPASTNGLAVTAIGENAFAESTLTSVTIPDGVTTIGAYAFEYCTALGKVCIPGSVIDIGEYAFEECISLTNAVIADGVSSIGYGMFDSCYNLPGVTIPGSVTNIGAFAFEGDNGLTTITIPAGVTSIGGSAFENCSSLDGVYFKGKAPAAVSSVFDFDSVVTVYYLPGAAGWNVPFAALAPVLWNPTIQASGARFGARSNQFGFNITGTSNIPMVVEACADLSGSVWVPLQTLLLTNGLCHFSEPMPSNGASRCYRISSP